MQILLFKKAMIYLIHLIYYKVTISLIPTLHNAIFPLNNATFPIPEVIIHNWIILISHINK